MTIERLSEIYLTDDMKNIINRIDNNTQHYQFSENNMIESAVFSNKIEDIHSSENFAKLIKSGIIKNYDYNTSLVESDRLIYNYYDINYLYHNNKLDLVKLNINLILDIHKRLSDNIYWHSGMLKQTDNIIVDGNQRVVFKPTPAFLTKNKLEDLIKIYNELDFHPLIKIPIFIFDFLCIHPFTDGNGRVSRLLTNILLLKEGYNITNNKSLEKIISENLDEYYFSLRASQSNWEYNLNSVETWLKFFLTKLEKAYF